MFPLSSLEMLQLLLTILYIPIYIFIHMSHVYSCLRVTHRYLWFCVADVLCLKKPDEESLKSALQSVLDLAVLEFLLELGRKAAKKKKKKKEKKES